MKTLNWTEHEGFQETRPLDVDTVSSPTTVYLRRNIREVPNTDPEGGEAEGTHWQYEEAELTLAEYQEYLIEQRFADLENAACEESMANEERLADIENALCELSDAILGE